MITGYRRVTRRSPCRICGKPDWCSTTLDQNISFCARSTTNADRLSRDGWGIYYYNIKRLISARGAYSVKRQSHSNQTPVASIEHRNKIYRKLIELAPFTKWNKLSSGVEPIRGAPFRELDNHGRFPRTVIERHRLVGSIIESFERDEGIVPMFKGVPGFWRGSNGSPRLGSDFDFVDDLLLIPFIDSNGLIQACQIRCVRNAPSMPGKYLWLSSIRQRDGCSPGTPLHHEGACGFKGKSIRTVLVTEGALKAATVQKFLPDRYVVGNSGVATSHRKIVETARGKPLEIAFDNDSFTNPHVARALASLIAQRTREQVFLSYEHSIRIITWDKRFKGIDDALNAGATLKYLNVSEWFRSLTPECFDAARHQLEGVSLQK